MNPMSARRANGRFQFTQRLKPVRREFVDRGAVSVDTSLIAVGAFVTVVSYPSGNKLCAAWLNACSYKALSERRSLRVAPLLNSVLHTVQHLYMWLVSLSVAVLARTSPPASVVRRTMRGAVSVEYLLITAIVSLVLFYDFDGSGSAAQKFFSAIRLLYSKFTYALSRAA
jgi:Flp pilus assembly pilin Flp